MLKISRLKNIFYQFQHFFTFLIKFILFYVVFTFIYKLYLNQYDLQKNEVDGITQSVAFQTKQFMLLFDSNVEITQHETEPAIKMLFHSKYIARIIEGCNAISIMILFASFVFAFSTQFKKTTLYIVFGILLIHVLNIVRIAILSFSLYYFPEEEELLHGTFFPLFIYGVVFSLWVLWVTKFSGYVKKTI
ncbi:exosortase family protein XrtF [Flavobacterium sp.]|uniref:exosortase family protein XrtF n=1 Tax=Flavobacterium sp. TaxID=239 RepID=UPI002FDC8DC9